MNTFEVFFSGTAMQLYPIDTLVALLRFNETESIEIPKRYPFQNEWGEESSTMLLLKKEHSIPQKLDIVYISLVEETIYSIEKEIPYKFIEDEWIKAKRNGTPFEYFIVGMAPFGYTSIWLRGTKKSILVYQTIGTEIKIDNDILMQITMQNDLHLYCSQYIQNLPVALEHFNSSGLPPRNLFDNYMKQFSYRYLVLFEKWRKDEEEWEKYADNENVPVFDFIEESLYDGTHDKLHDGGLMKYHQAGKPKKLRVEWHIGKSEYSAYFWFEDERIREVFDRFYGAHPDTKTDFIIRIDAEKRKYELALYRYGLKGPQVIPEDVYQLLVFKNKFEDYRSDNYNQERGAWIW